MEASEGFWSKAQLASLYNETYIRPGASFLGIENKAKHWEGEGEKGGEDLGWAGVPCLLNITLKQAVEFTPC